MITFNQAHVVRTAVESVLAQRAPFEIELVIGDDQSTDGTAEVLHSLANNNPGRVRLLPMENHHGIMPNFGRTLNACRGKYVAICEGDDYWIDDFKLVRQVEYLEDHPGCVLCFHNAYIEYEDGQRIAFHRDLTRTVFEGRDLFEQWLIPTASAVFRNPCMTSFPAFAEQWDHGDLALWLTLADSGTLDYLDKPMSVYRRHSGGVTNSFQGIPYNNRQIGVYELIDRHFNYGYHSLVRRHISGLQRSNALQSVEMGDRRGAAVALWESIQSSMPRNTHELREVLQVCVGLASVRGYRVLRDGFRRLT